MVETCSLTLYNVNKTVVLTCRSINYKEYRFKWGAESQG